MSDQNKPKLPPPSFLRRSMPSSIVTNNGDEEDDGRTRRVAFSAPASEFRPRHHAMHRSADLPSLMSTGPIKIAPPPTTLKNSPPTLKEIPVDSYAWSNKIFEDDIKTLPPMYRLERTAEFVPNVTLVGRVLDRIDRVLRERSIEVHFDRNRAKCTTMEGVEFRINLFRGRGRFSHGIIVEVQRLDGTSLSFHQDTQAILRAALHEKPHQEPRTEHLPPEIVSDSDDDENDFDREGKSSGALEMISNMFQHPGTQHLGLEALVTFTSPDRMSSKTAAQVSSQLLEAGNVVGAKVVALILNDRSDKELRIMAMEALGNALQHASRYTLPTDKLRLVLKQDLWHCDENPRAAYMAARCLEHMMDAHDQELNEALRKSRAFGQSRYAALAQQSRKCLGCY